MHSLKIDFRYLPDKSHEYYRQEGNIESSAYAMHWCMLATNVNRIFSKEDMQEFIYRLTLLIASEEVIESWLNSQELFRYRFKEQEYSFTLNDLISYFGLEIIDHVENMADRTYFESNIAKTAGQALFVSDKEQLSIISPIGIELLKSQKLNEKQGSKSKETKYETFVFNKKRKELASFLAGDIFRFIPDSLFSVTNPAIVIKKEELRKRRERINSLPVFHFQKLSKKKLHHCLITMFNKEYALEIENDLEEVEKVAKPLIYLAWLYANDLMVFEDWDYIPVEGIEFRYEDYMDENDSFLLKQTIEDYFLEDLKPILEGFY